MDSWFEPLLPVLEQAKAYGFLGPSPVEDQIERSAGIAVAAGFEPADGGLAVDLGSGGGLPGLVLAHVWSGCRWVLLDANQRRTSWLLSAVDLLGIAHRVEVISGRAEEIGRGPMRTSAAVVVARGFGPPAVTAECAAPLLMEGGKLIVTEPPGGAADRWSVEGLGKLGLRLQGVSIASVAVAVMEQVEVCPSNYPRRVGIPGKRPLWS